MEGRSPSYVAGQSRSNAYTGFGTANAMMERGRPRPHEREARTISRALRALRTRMSALQVARSQSHQRLTAAERTQPCSVAQDFRTTKTESGGTGSPATRAAATDAR